ncbi:MAG TPA: hypothetical protein VFY10_03815 [Dehalococcoidia bacterium]|nr:hypothetical protein [Dehalococcoidia bacterium]
MRSPFFVTRLAAFTIALLLLGGSIDAAWGISPASGWVLAVFLLTLISAWDLVSLVACALAFLMLVGAVEETRAAFIALSVFTGAAFFRPRSPRLWRAWTMPIWRNNATPLEGNWRWNWRH